jgi:DegV family protein with EDD domain
MTVAIVTDSGSDLSPAQLRDNGIAQVDLSVAIGDKTWLVPDELSPEDFWKLMRGPDSPFAKTAAPSSGQFKMAFEQAFEAGADEIVYVALSESLSATIQSGRLGRDMLPGRRIHVVDSRSASLGVGALAIRGAKLAAEGKSGTEIADFLNGLARRTLFFVCLETLEYLRRGGRISAARAAVGGLLSVKPIITIDENATLVAADSPRTRGKALERITELLSARPVEELHILAAPPAEVAAFREEILSRLPGPAPMVVTTNVIGPVIGAHVGPGAYGGLLVFPA